MAMTSTSGDQVCPVILKFIMKFDTNNKGYKVCLEVYPADCETGKGTHLSCYIVLMKGPHDDNLSWPLRDKFEMTLLNQISDGHHRSISVDYGNSSHINSGRVTKGDKATGISIPYSGKVWQGETLANLLFLSIWRKKVWRMNRIANRLSIVTTNLDGISLVNHGRFAKFAKLSLH